MRPTGGGAEGPALDGHGPAGRPTLPGSRVAENKHSKTEQATPQKRKKAREEGQVARSQEIPVATSLLAATIALSIIGRPAFDAASQMMRASFLGAGQQDALEASAGLALDLVLVMAVPMLGVAIVAGVAAGVAQVGVHLYPKAAKPKFSRLNPKKGLEKFKPAVAGWELIRSTAKLGAVAAVVWPSLSAWREHLATDRTLAGAIDRLTGAYGGILLRATALAAVIAVADLIYQRRRLDKQLRMTKDEVRREHKDAEGDPQLRAARKRRASDLSRNRMLRDTASADVLLVNPTHLAVALLYDPVDGAPKVVAKGADRVADKLRAIAHRNGIPITADVPLARALFRRCKVGQHVPSALYEAVAIVLAVAYRRSGRGPASRPLDSPPRRRVRSVRSPA